MLTTVISCTLAGVDMHQVSVEVDITYGASVYATIGLAELAVRESRDRVKSALLNCGLDCPPDRIVVTLGPPELRKDGALLDLPIALGILASSGALPTTFCERFLVIGELALSGALRPVRGALTAALLARDLGRDLILPQANAREASAIEGVRVFGAASLGDAVAHLRGSVPLTPEPLRPISFQDPQPESTLDLADVRGQGPAKRALVIAAAGEHNLLLVGTPGSGKTMLARRLPGLLPPLSASEAIDTAKVHSAAGLLNPEARLVARRPFRAPHHSISDMGITGGGNMPRPGEVSLAHNGVLFLDELPEFRRSTLEVLRQPLEEGSVHLARAHRGVSMPARFLLCTAMNPCPCGFWGDSTRSCRCPEANRKRYLARVNGPLLERSDVVSHTQAAAPDATSTDAITSALAREAVSAARQRQAGRGQSVPNGRLQGSDLEEFAQLAAASRTLVLREAQRLALDAPAQQRLVRVARTIADLAGADLAVPEHVLEALNYRHTLTEF